MHSESGMKCSTFLFFAATGLLLVSCGGGSTGEPEKTPPGEEAGKATETDRAGTAPPPAVAAPAVPQVWSEVKLHEAIRSANAGYSGNGQFQIDENGQPRAIALDNCGVTDLSPLKGMPLMMLALQNCAVPDIEALKGMPLVELYLENTAVKDLSPLEGMATLKKLYLSGTIVSDLSPLRGLPIIEMNLVNTRVSDLSGLEGMPLSMLWLTDSPVEDISPLKASPLVSLTLHRTPVMDLSPLSGTQLQRLHIGETPVTDLSPLKGMGLTRLVFDPDRIEKGMDAVKQIPSMQQIGTKFEDGANDLKPPAVFWQERG